MSRISRRETLAWASASAPAFPSPCWRAPDEAAGRAAPARTFTLLLVNDIYQAGDDKGRGGFAKLAAVVKAERARGVPDAVLPCRRQFLALADVGLRPGRAYRRA